MDAATATRGSDRDRTLDSVFKALGDPTRRAIIAQLTHGDATMTQIADQFDMSLPGVSKHVTVLEDAGLVRRWRSGRSRHCRLEIEPMEVASEWLTGQARFWTHTLDALSAFLEGESTT